MGGSGALRAALLLIMVRVRESTSIGRTPLTRSLVHSASALASRSQSTVASMRCPSRRSFSFLSPASATCRPPARPSQSGRLRDYIGAVTVRAGGGPPACGRCPPACAQAARCPPAPHPGPAAVVAPCAGSPQLPLWCSAPANRAKQAGPQRGPPLRTLVASMRAVR